MIVFRSDNFVGTQRSTIVRPFVVRQKGKSKHDVDDQLNVDHPEKTPLCAADLARGRVNQSHPHVDRGRCNFVTTMSSKIDVIAAGYAYMLNSPDQAQEGTDIFMKATGSCCLVQSGGTRVLFDTMGPWERDLLLERLSKLKIHQNDIDYLVCSHSHPDHIGNINLFTNARKHFIGTSVYSQDVYDLNCFNPIGSYKYKTKRNVEVDVLKHKGYQLEKNLTIEPTKGHTMECITLLVENCDNYGLVGLVGDLYERQEDIDDESIWLLAGSQDPDLQRANRAQIFNRVDYILPGHGPIFKVDKNKDISF